MIHYVKRLMVLAKTIRIVTNPDGIQMEARWETVTAVVLELRRIADSLEKEVSNARDREELVRNGG